MKSSSWFPEEDVPIKPVAGRTSPPLWVRRIVVVEERTPDAAVIREVPFRPGLNVVCVADHPPREARPVGHSVGKTLLARLIRYCLGERYFAKESVLDRMRRDLPKAYVVAEIELAGVVWAVSRPVGDTATGESYAIPADDWRAGVADIRGPHAFGNFQNALAESIVSAMPTLTLPDAGRSARWLDLLAWLSRDQECSYRHYGEWRNPDANSQNGRLHRNDASLVLSWAMGFLDTDSSELMAGHSKLLNEQSEAKSEFERRSARLEFWKESLRTRLSLEAEDGPDEFFVQKVRENARGTIESLRRLQAEFEEDVVATLSHADVVRLERTLGGVESELDRVRGLRQEAQGELMTVSQSTDQQFYDKFYTGPTCPLSRQDCSLGSPPPAKSVEDPRRKARIVELKAQVTRLEEEILQLQERFDRLDKERKLATWY